jgi:hypothetical protein
MESAKTVLVRLADIKSAPIADELCKSENMCPYIDHYCALYDGNAEKIEATLKVLRALPANQRYTTRVISALKWAFADFDSETIRLDLPYIPDSERKEIQKELGMRLLQVNWLIGTFAGTYRRPL